jgi:DNA polymerase-1
MSDARKAVTFNPASPDDLKGILYGEDFMDLPVIDLTDTKEPATGGDTLGKLRNHTDSDEIIEFIDALIDFKAVDKLITSFLPRFLEAYQDANGWHWLFGNFNLGGTVSGRLSSSGPNLQNLPANGYWAKKVKNCFKAPPGYLFIGLDFASLEDRISALQTKDPEKLKVYIDGFDGHCLRAYSYFGDQMPDINGDTVEGINSIKKLYGDLRGESKTPTFLLTYAGTWRGIMDQMGWTKEKSQSIEEKYHELYVVSDAWVAAQIEQATKVGFVTCAFGLRVRTPILGKTVLGTRKIGRAHV